MNNIEKYRSQSAEADFNARRARAVHLLTNARKALENARNPAPIVAERLADVAALGWCFTCPKEGLAALQ